MNFREGCRGGEEKRRSAPSIERQVKAKVFLLVIDNWLIYIELFDIKRIDCD